MRIVKYSVVVVVLFFLGLSLTSGFTATLSLDVYPESSDISKFEVKCLCIDADGKQIIIGETSYNVTPTDTLPIRIEFDKIDGGIDCHCSVQDTYPDGTKGEVSENSMAIPVPPDDCMFDLKRTE
ncbi:hypothetical protein DSLASN_27170 [Desulfoluna limicola]|uniref:Uncharacterized protein n=1 Tax=Desulfoluna limicola TaxID=2810562 RepID=A0ABM7PIH0_9BACT|nr:hypothetical protein [Desulfoluna limicola]BCS97085.1 hypothetical protein DSLASN_27170 [Desulfoluna limicola]